MTVTVPGERSAGDGLHDVRDTLAPASGVGLAMSIAAPSLGNALVAEAALRAEVNRAAEVNRTELNHTDAASSDFASGDFASGDTAGSHAAGSDAAGESALRVIKRYSNRKLYDTKSSRYVTLPQIADLLRTGENVQIVDNRTKEDKTEVTLALIISEELRVSPRGIPLATLTALITRNSEALSADPSKIRRLEAEIHRLNDRLAELERRLAATRE
jgi:polyhydroxyalkanoate synthesis repressor PhaR